MGFVGLLWVCCLFEVLVCILLDCELFSLDFDLLLYRCCAVGLWVCWRFAVFVAGCLTVMMGFLMVLVACGECLLL